MKASTPFFKAHPWIKLLVTPPMPHPGVGTPLQVAPTGVTGLLETQAGTEASQSATAGSGPVVISLEIWAEGLSVPHALTHPEQGLTFPITIVIYRN